MILWAFLAVNFALLWTCALACEDCTQGFFWKQPEQEQKHQKHRRQTDGPWETRGKAGAAVATAAAVRLPPCNSTATNVYAAASVYAATRPGLRATRPGLRAACRSNWRAAPPT